jgi:hypothetical protein
MIVIFKLVIYISSRYAHEYNLLKLSQGGCYFHLKSLYNLKQNLNFGYFIFEAYVHIKIPSTQCKVSSVH